MAQKSNITVFSTFAVDRLVGESGILLGQQNGGPAFYLQQAFDKAKASFILRTGMKMDVQILLTTKGEFGKIPQKPLQSQVKFSGVSTPYAAVSTILNEFDLAGLPTYNGKVFLDIQGYVRNGNDFGRKKSWKPSREIFENIFCLKGTREEFRYLPVQYIQAQKQKILIITKGARGCEVFAFGKGYIVRPPKIISQKNTIGAGDTFFAYFISRFIKTTNALDGASYAVKRTSMFLATRNPLRHNNLFREEFGVV